MLSILSLRCSVKEPCFSDNSVYPITLKVLGFLKILHLAESLLLAYVVICQYNYQSCTQHNTTALGTIHHVARYSSPFDKTTH